MTSSGDGSRFGTKKAVGHSTGWAQASNLTRALLGAAGNTIAEAT